MIPQLRSTTKRQTVMIAFRMSADQAGALELACIEAGTTISDGLRQIINWYLTNSTKESDQTKALPGSDE